MKEQYYLDPVPHLPADLRSASGILDDVDEDLDVVEREPSAEEQFELAMAIGDRCRLIQQQIALHFGSVAA